MNNEHDFEFAEYNPKAIELNLELKALAKMIKTPKMSFFQKLMQKIITAGC